MWNVRCAQRPELWLPPCQCQLNMDVGTDQCNYIKHRFCLFGGNFSKHSAVPYPRAFVYHESKKEILIGVSVAVIILLVSIVTLLVESCNPWLFQNFFPHSDEDSCLSCVQLHKFSELWMIFCLEFIFWWDIGLSILLFVSEIWLISVNFMLDWMVPVVCQALLFLFFWGSPESDWNTCPRSVPISFVVSSG